MKEESDYRKHIFIYIMEEKVLSTTIWQYAQWVETFFQGIILISMHCIFSMKEISNAPSKKVLQPIMKWKQIISNLIQIVTHAHSMPLKALS